ncbi:MAG: class IV adenylate cyclase [Candidatus Paceibacterota bacterium]|jgi:adenylate cyclase class 2
MNEIEVKAKLKDKEAVMNRLKEMGLKIHASKYQKDTIYWPNDIKDPSGRLFGRNFLRIREQKIGENKKILFTLKQQLKSSLDSIEHELEIKEEDIPKMFEIFELLDFYKYITVEKERTTAKMGDVEICIDDVKGLGSFIELEKFGEVGQADKIHEELYAILESWGITKEDYVYVGYDILMYKAKNL